NALGSMSAVSPLAVASASNVLTAWCIGSGEIWISPPNPRSNPRIIPNAPATASAQSVRVTADVRLRGANRPKLANSNVSQTQTEAEEFLRHLLGDGPRPAKDVEAEAKEAGIAWRTVNRAKKPWAFSPSGKQTAVTALGLLGACIGLCQAAPIRLL